MQEDDPVHRGRPLCARCENRCIHPDREYKKKSGRNCFDSVSVSITLISLSSAKSALANPIPDPTIGRSVLIAESPTPSRGGLLVLLAQSVIALVDCSGRLRTLEVRDSACPGRLIRGTDLHEVAFASMLRIGLCGSTAKRHPPHRLRLLSTQQGRGTRGSRKGHRTWAQAT
jgi:hypothetical protein